MNIARLGITALAFTAATAATLPAAEAATPRRGTVQNQIDQQLRNYPGGKQIGANRVAYDHGQVVVVFPDDTATSAPGAEAACPTGSYCFYETRDFGGRMLQLTGCGGTRYFSDYGFRDIVSSWRNPTQHLIIHYDQDTLPNTPMWSEYPQTESVYVGDLYNDRADYFDVICDVT